jgi:1,4-dihydroxy-2-naphthoate octaprenyltransferase
MAAVAAKLYKFFLKLDFLMQFMIWSSTRVVRLGSTCHSYAMLYTGRSSEDSYVGKYT